MTGPYRVVAHDQEWFERASYHLAYELGMLAWCTHDVWESADRPDNPNVIPGEAPDNHAQARHNAMLEALLIHARVLIDFLVQRRTDRAHRDDVFAEDFYDSAEAWLAVRVTRRRQVHRLSETRVRINKAVAHLSDVRLPGRCWDLAPILKDLCDVLQLFAVNVPREKLSGLTRANIDALCALLTTGRIDEDVCVSTAGAIAVEGTLSHHPEQQPSALPPL